MAGLTISFTKKEIITVTGHPVSIDFSVKSSMGNNPGQLQIDFKTKSTHDTVISCTTYTDGAYSNSMDISKLKPGKNYITAF